MLPLQETQKAVQISCTSALVKSSVYQTADEVIVTRNVTQREKNWPRAKGSSGTNRSIIRLRMEPLVHTRFACAFDRERMSYQEMR